MRRGPEAVAPDRSMPRDVPVAAHVRRGDGQRGTPQIPGNTLLGLIHRVQLIIYACRRSQGLIDLRAGAVPTEASDGDLMLPGTRRHEVTRTTRRRIDLLRDPSCLRGFVFAAVLVAGVMTASNDVEQTTPGTQPPAALVASFDGMGVGFEGPQGTAALRNPSDN